MYHSCFVDQLYTKSDYHYFSESILVFVRSCIEKHRTKEERTKWGEDDHSGPVFSR
jgi:hypothetical protein